MEKRPRNAAFVTRAIIATSTRATIPATNATPIASALMKTMRGPMTVAARGTCAAARVGASEGETGNNPVTEIGVSRSRSAMASTAFLDQRWTLFEEQTGNLLRSIGALDDFGEQARQRGQLALLELRERPNQAILCGLGRAFEQRTPRASEAELDAAAVRLGASAAHVPQRDQAADHGRDRALIGSRARRKLVHRARAMAGETRQNEQLRPGKAHSLLRRPRRDTQGAHDLSQRIEDLANFQRR